MKENSPLNRRRIFLLLVGMLTLSITGFSQNPSVRVYEDWNVTSGTQNDMQRCVTRSKALGGTTYYYLCGSTLNSSGNYDILIQKKSASGTVLWSQTYNGAGNKDDYATDVQISNSGSVYVSGTFFKNSTDSNNAIILKYSASGSQQWAYTYNGTGSRHDAFAAMQLSTSAVVAVGTTWKNTTNMYDMLAVRCDTNGNSVWVQNWDYSALNDGAVNLWNSGTKVYIAGGAQSASTTYKYAVVNVKFSDGSIQGSTVTGGTAFGIDQVTDIQTDGSMYMYVTGAVLNANTLYDWKTIKLDTALNIIWSAVYDSGDSLNDIATGLTIDQVGNVIVTGYKTDATSGKDYVTIKYRSNGTQQWVSSFDGGINAADSATAIVVSPTDTNKIYVTGFSYNVSSKDYWTLKYDAAGNRKWDIGFNNIYNTDDRGLAIALDTLGNIIVAGQNKLNDSTHTYTTVKYIEKSTTLPDDTITYVSNSIIFIQNNDQLLDSDTMQRPEIKYYMMTTADDVYFMDTAVSFVLSKLDTTATLNDTLCRVDMKFEGANSDLRIRSLDKREDYSNFFLGHLPEGRSCVPHYNQLVSFDVWDNVDVVFGNSMTGLKYYFICKPLGGGSSASQIDLKFEGADSVKINGSGQLVIYTKLGTIIQEKAAAWQLDANGDYSALGWQPSYTILGTNEVGFTSFGSYNNAYPIVIAIQRGPQPPPPVTIQNLNWSTFFGGGQDAFLDIAVSINTGEVAVGGHTTSALFPATPGAAFPTFPGWMQSAVIVKFHQDHTLHWASFYGGDLLASGNPGATTQIYGVDFDAQDNIFFTGTTQAINLPLQPWGSSYYQSNQLSSTCIGCVDAFIGRMREDGTALDWATYYSSGAFGTEIAYSVKVSPFNGDVYMVGYGSTIPTYNTAAWHNSGASGFIVRFDQIGIRQTAGKMGMGRVYDVTIDALGNAVVCGYVTSGSNFTLTAPTTPPTGNSTFAGGAADAFVAKIQANSTNTLIWSIFFGGSGDDYANGIAVTPAKEYIVTGSTTSSYSAGLPPIYDPGSGAYYQNSLNGNSDAFVAMFNPVGTMLWATYYGGSDDEVGQDVAVDGVANIYITGHVESTDMPLPSPNLLNGYNHSDYDASPDSYVAGFWHGTYAPVWATYFGASNDQWGHGLGCDGTSELYLTGWTQTLNDFPLATGSGSPTPYFDGVVAGTKGFVSAFDLNTVLAVGMSDPVANSLQIGLYPNPTSDILYISGPTNSSEPVVIEIYDVLGNLVYLETLPACSNCNHSVNLSEMACGMYLVKVTSGITCTSEKIVIQR